MDAALLEPIAAVEVPGVALFVAKDKFRAGETTDGVKISQCSDEFEYNFLGKKTWGQFTQSGPDNFLGKIEKDVAPAVLRISKLKQPSSNASIIAELGLKCEIPLAHLWELLKKQGSEQKDLLHANYINMAYIRDVKNKLWVVVARGVGDWLIYANSVDVMDISDVGFDNFGTGTRSFADPDRFPWDAGSRIISR